MPELPAYDLHEVPLGDNETYVAPEEGDNVVEEEQVDVVYPKLIPTHQVLDYSEFEAFTELPSEKPGVCPAPEGIMVEGCYSMCSTDFDCPASGKCCAYRCGHVCMPALPDTLPATTSSPGTH